MCVWDVCASVKSFQSFYGVILNNTERIRNTNTGSERLRGSKIAKRLSKNPVLFFVLIFVVLLLVLFSRVCWMIHPRLDTHIYIIWGCSDILFAPSFINTHRMCECVCLCVFFVLFCCSKDIDAANYWMEWSVVLSRSDTVFLFADH